MSRVYLASSQQVKMNAAKRFFREVVCRAAPSGVSEQPFGREEIVQGVRNRVGGILGVLPVLGFETGIIRRKEGKDGGHGYYDVTCCLLRTHMGDFMSFVSHTIRSDLIHTWARLENRSAVTFGSMFAPDTPNDWYIKDNPQGNSRESCMGKALLDVCCQYTAARVPYVPMTTYEFKGVNFIDIESAVNSGKLTRAVRQLAHGLLFNKVIFPESRGFLFAGEFARDGYEVILARKPEKLPGSKITASYKKEYGADSISIREDAVKPGDRVLIVDDVIATGGTMRAIDSLVTMSGGVTVAFIAPYALLTENGQLMCGDLSSRCRYLSETPQAYECKLGSHPAVVNIFPPSLKCYSSEDSVVTWGEFAHSSDIWIRAGELKDKVVRIFMNTLRKDEMTDVKAVLDILYRKDVHKIQVIVPFMEPATQDIIREENNSESIAQVDTLGKLLGKHTVHTFDIHNRASHFAFHDLRNHEMVSRLWHMFHEEHPHVIPVFPDEGAEKRFGGMVTGPRVVFSKRRSGAAREVHTSDPIIHKEYVIVDDLVRSGGTMNAVARYLKEQGAQKVSAIFAHFCSEKDTAKNMRNISDVWCSDSCGDVPREYVKIRVLDILDSYLSE